MTDTTALAYPADHIFGPDPHGRLWRRCADGYSWESANTLAGPWYKANHAELAFFLIPLLAPVATNTADDGDGSGWRFDLDTETWRLLRTSEKVR